MLISFQLISEYVCLSSIKSLSQEDIFLLRFVFYFETNSNEQKINLSILFVTLGLVMKQTQSKPFPSFESVTNNRIKCFMLVHRLFWEVTKNNLFLVYYYIFIIYDSKNGNKENILKLRKKIFKILNFFLVSFWYNKYIFRKEWPEQFFSKSVSTKRLK